MKEGTAVARADTEPSSTSARNYFLPREELPVLASLFIPCVAALVLLPQLPGRSTVFTIPYLNTPVTLNVAVLVIVFCAAYLLGSTAAWRTVIRPLHAINAWLKKGREARFVTLPPSPKLRPGALQDLHREIAASIAQFSSASVNNDALSKEKSELLVVAAHQLHTPMTEVRWGVEQLLDASTPADAKEELAKNISTSLRRLSSVIDNIVASSDIDTDAAKYVFEPVDLVAMINDAMKEFALFARERKVEVSFQHEAAAPVRADAYRLSNVFFNILSNAIGYTPAGGKVTISLATKADGVECSIADTGIGIPEKDMQRLFTKFQRGEHAKHARPDGSGLGLYLVKNILNAHGSDVVVRSQDGVGTTVTFTLPKAK